MGFIDYVAEYFRGPQGETGPAGPAGNNGAPGVSGAPGEQGPAGPGVNFYAKTGVFDMLLESPATGSASVTPDNEGDIVISGSYYATNGDDTTASDPSVILVTSTSYDGVDWSFNWVYNAPSGQTDTGNLYYRVVFATPTE